ncbi:ATP-binding cassette domain-containing protein, partial [candidate division KSB1 bacterium]|nr:ATP-binding cassette domain-containing protein [candidate division KSB1 bacterium]
NVYIDGNDIRDLSLHSLRKLTGIVTQDTILFNDTIRANISYGMEGMSDGQIIEAARAANAWEFISKTEHQLDSIVGEKGVNLSGGQKQRISIARAILKNPPILILDEATSALDTESEKLVQDAIDTLMQHRTVLVIAHRLSTVIHADRIVVLNRGEVVDVGPHRRLLKSCPLYRMLYEMQFRDEMNN